MEKLIRAEVVNHMEKNKLFSKKAIWISKRQIDNITTPESAR